MAVTPRQEKGLFVFASLLLFFLLVYPILVFIEFKIGKPFLSGRWREALLVSLFALLIIQICYQMFCSMGCFTDDSKPSFFAHLRRRKERAAPPPDRIALTFPDFSINGLLFKSSLDDLIQKTGRWFNVRLFSAVIKSPPFPVALGYNGGLSRVTLLPQESNHHTITLNGEPLPPFSDINAWNQLLGAPPPPSWNRGIIAMYCTKALQARPKYPFPKGKKPHRKSLLSFSPNRIPTRSVKRFVMRLIKNAALFTLLSR